MITEYRKEDCAEWPDWIDFIAETPEEGMSLGIFLMELQDRNIKARYTERGTLTIPIQKYAIPQPESESSPEATDE